MAEISTEKRIIKCCGPAPGCKPSSYRAEAYGLLSTLRFLIQIYTYFGIADQNTFTHLCDSESVIKVLTAMMKYDDYYPNATHSADWDVLQQCKDGLRNLPDQCQLQHIHSHQDEKKAYEDLSFEVQLNVDADHLADKFMTQYHHGQFLKVPLLPVNGAQLHLPRGTITNKLKREILDARNRPAVLQKLCDDNDWDINVQPMFIEWQTHGQVYRALQAHATTLTKFLYAILPVGKRVHRYDPIYPHECPTCDAPYEDEDHLYRCPHQSRRQWLIHFSTSIRYFGEKLNSRPGLPELIVDGITSWIDERPLPTSYSRQPALNNLIEQQTMIGWDHLLKGRFCVEWKILQQEHLDTISAEKKKEDKIDNADTWLRKIIRKIWVLWLELWKQRNEDRHGRDLASLNLKTREQAIREAELLYAMKNDVQAELQYAFQSPWNTFITKPTNTIRMWLSLHRANLHRSAAPTVPD